MNEIKTQTIELAKRYLVGRGQWAEPALDVLRMAGTPGDPNDRARVFDALGDLQRAEPSALDDIRARDLARIALKAWLADDDQEASSCPTLDELDRLFQRRRDQGA